MPRAVSYLMEQVDCLASYALQMMDRRTKAAARCGHAAVGMVLLLFTVQLFGSGAPKVKGC